jgi:hypothetical protein
MALKPYRQYSETSVINGLFAFTNATSAESGTIVRISSNYKNLDGENIDILSDLSNLNNIISAVIGPVGRVERTNFFDDPYRPIGIILKSIASEDENGNLLAYNPRKAAEMDVILPNIQSVPILTSGIIFTNNIDTANHTPAGGGDPNPGDTAYAGDSGSFATDGIIAVGQFLSTKDSDGYALIRIQF